MIETLGILGTFIGVFGIFDVLVEKKHKYKISEYIFGFSDVSFVQFEQNSIQGLVNIFVTETSLKFLKIFFFYTLVGFFICYFIFFQAEDVSEIIEEDDDIFIYHIFAFFLLILTCSYLCDLYSIWITKRIFYNKRRAFPSSVKWIFIDVLLSMLPSLSLAVLLIYLINQNDDLNYGIPIAVFIFLSSLPSILMSLITLVILMVGFLLKGITRLTYINRGVAMVSKAHEFPFTYFGLFAGILAVLLTELI